MVTMRVRHVKNMAKCARLKGEARVIHDSADHAGDVKGRSAGASRNRNDKWRRTVACTLFVATSQSFTPPIDSRPFAGSSGRQWPERCERHWCRR